MHGSEGNRAAAVQGQQRQQETGTSLVPHHRAVARPPSGVSQDESSYEYYEETGSEYSSGYDSEECSETTYTPSNVPLFFAMPLGPTAGCGNGMVSHPWGTSLTSASCMEPRSPPCTEYGAVSSASRSATGWCLGVRDAHSSSNCIRRTSASTRDRAAINSEREKQQQQQQQLPSNLTRINLMKAVFPGPPTPCTETTAKAPVNPSKKQQQQQQQQQPPEIAGKLPVPRPQTTQGGTMMPSLAVKPRLRPRLESARLSTANAAANVLKDNNINNSNNKQIQPSTTTGRPPLPPEKGLVLPRVEEKLSNTDDKIGSKSPTRRPNTIPKTCGGPLNRKETANTTAKDNDPAPDMTVNKAPPGPPRSLSREQAAGTPHHRSVVRNEGNKNITVKNTQLSSGTGAAVANKVVASDAKPPPTTTGKVNAPAAPAPAPRLLESAPSAPVASAAARASAPLAPSGGGGSGGGDVKKDERTTRDDEAKQRAKALRLELDGVVTRRGVRVQESPRPSNRTIAPSRTKVSAMTAGALEKPRENQTDTVTIAAPGSTAKTTTTMATTTAASVGQNVVNTLTPSKITAEAQAAAVVMSQGVSIHSSNAQGAQSQVRAITTKVKKREVPNKEEKTTMPHNKGAYSKNSVVPSSDSGVSVCGLGKTQKFTSGIDQNSLPQQPQEEAGDDEREMREGSEVPGRVRGAHLLVMGEKELKRKLRRREIAERAAILNDIIDRQQILNTRHNSRQEGVNNAVKFVLQQPTVGTSMNQGMERGDTMPGRDSIGTTPKKNEKCQNIAPEPLNVTAVSDSPKRMDEDSSQVGRRTHSGENNAQPGQTRRVPPVRRRTQRWLMEIPPSNSSSRLQLVECKPIISHHKENGQLNEFCPHHSSKTQGVPLHGTEDSTFVRVVDNPTHIGHHDGSKTASAHHPTPLNTENESDINTRTHNNSTN